MFAWSMPPAAIARRRVPTSSGVPTIIPGRDLIQSAADTFLRDPSWPAISSTSRRVGAASTWMKRLRFSVAGSRPTALHASGSVVLSSAMRGSTGSLGFDMLNHCAYFAAMRITRGLVPPIQIGSGFCIGFGEQSAFSIR